jgi:hypothetical protein
MQMMGRRMRPRLLLLVVALVAQQTWARIAQAQQGGSGSLCSVVSTPLNFGTYLGTNSAPTDYTATVTVTCVPAPGNASALVSFTVAFVAGGGATGQRQLASAQGSLLYALYADPGRGFGLGDGAGGAATLSGGGVATDLVPLRQSFTVYGRILARQGRAPAGAYMDVVMVRLSY